jgi:hypothetical protein
MDYKKIGLDPGDDYVLEEELSLLSKTILQ